MRAFANFRTLTPCVVVAMSLFACSDFPESPNVDRRVTRLQVSACASLGPGETCPITVRAWNTSGEEISNPDLLWSSSRPSVARVEHPPGELYVLGVAPGHATIRATDVTRTATDDFAVQVEFPDPPDRSR